MCVSLCVGGSDSKYVMKLNLESLPQILESVSVAIFKIVTDLRPVTDHLGYFDFILVPHSSCQVYDVTTCPKHSVGEEVLGMFTNICVVPLNMF